MSKDNPEFTPAALEQIAEREAKRCEEEMERLQLLLDTYALMHGQYTAVLMALRNEDDADPESEPTQDPEERRWF